MTKLKKARAMKCFGKLVERVELGPFPKAQDKLKTQDELTKNSNCENCDAHEYCCSLADTLQD